MDDSRPRRRRCAVTISTVASGHDRDRTAFAGLAQSSRVQLGESVRGDRMMSSEYDTIVAQATVIVMSIPLSLWVGMLQ
jgi:hypothetical protein